MYFVSHKRKYEYMKIYALSRVGATLSATAANAEESGIGIADSFDQLLCDLLRYVSGPFGQWHFANLAVHNFLSLAVLVSGRKQRAYD
jgi:hypothetical protein